jgi:hypothetical protein
MMRYVPRDNGGGDAAPAVGFGGVSQLWWYDGG